MGGKKTAGAVHNEAFVALWKNCGKLWLVSLVLFSVELIIGAVLFLIMLPVRALIGFSPWSFFNMEGVGSLQEFLVAARPLLELFGINLLASAIAAVVAAIAQASALIGGYDAALRLLQDRNAPLKPVFANFRRNWLRFVGVIAWSMLWQFLWSLLFLVPGIVKYYSYRLAPFLVLRYPDMTVRQALRKSIEITGGYRGRLFGLDLLLVLYRLAALLASLLLPVVGSFAVNLLLVTPMMLLMFSVAYRDIGQAAIEKGLLPSERFILD